MDLRGAAELHRSGRLAEAESAYRQFLAASPSDANACNLLGLLLHQRGRLPEAIELLRRAVAIAPRVPDFARNLGLALGAAGRHEEAAARFADALRLRPDDPLTLNNLGVARERLGRLGQAAAAYRRAIVLKPDDADAHHNLGGALRKLGRVDEAVAAHGRAIALRPGFADACHGLANALADRGSLAAAVAAYRSAASLRPDSAAWHSDLLFALVHDPACTPHRMLDEARRGWAARFAEPLTASAPRHEPRRDADGSRRLRVGYVSPDFRGHTVARVIAPVLAAHDRTAFEVFCYASVRKPDGTTARLRSLCEHWRDIAHLGDEAAAALIRADRVDVLVDLAGHWADNRLPVFARRPAPAQAQLGYPATTGMSAIDYRVTDALSDPPGQTESHYTESLVRLPRCAWCYAPDADAPAPGPVPARANGGGRVTFACLNRPMKVADAAIACWARVLDAVPGSRLVVLAGLAGAGNATLRKRFEDHGIGAGPRLTLAPRLPRREYLRLMATADLALDTFPYNGETTTCDALWMGVPVVAIAGETCVARRSASHLHNVGLWDECVASDLDDYVRRAVALASDLGRLAHLRAGLRDRMARSPVVDGISYTRALEAAYRAMLAGR